MAKWYHCGHEGCDYKHRHHAPLNLHRFRAHGLLSNKPVKPATCKCSICDYVGPSLLGLAQHMSKTHGISVRDSTSKNKARDTMARPRKNDDDKAVHVTVSVPKHLKRRMEAMKKKINWSSVAKSAFEKETGASPSGTSLVKSSEELSTLVSDKPHRKTKRGATLIGGAIIPEGSWRYCPCCGANQGELVLTMAAAMTVSNGYKDKG